MAKSKVSDGAIQSLNHSQITSASKPEATLPFYARPPPPRPHKFIQSTFKRLLFISLSLFSLYYSFHTLKLFVYEYRYENAGVETLISQDVAHHRNPAYLIKARHGAAASENEICSNMGVDVLKDGGNAVDAAVSTTLCIGVVNMFSSGIGGGGFMTIRLPPSSSNASSSVWTVDFRETAPALANSSMFVGNPLLAIFGGLAVGVPGELRGLEEAWRRWGSLEWRRLVEPSARLARGWVVQEELGKRMNYPFFKDLMIQNADWSAIFAPNGTILNAGDTIHRTNLSRTLQTIADEGPSAFYNGSLTPHLVTKIRATGGVLSADDFASYKPIVRPALQGEYKGMKVYTAHAPTSGGVLLFMLRLAERLGLGQEVSSLSAHRITEIMKFGFAARTNVSDPAFTEDTARIDEIFTAAYADRIVGNVTDDMTHPPEYYNPVYDVKIDHGTSHSSIVDKDGMAVSITSTVNLVFGSQVMDPVTGVILNDEMDDFSTPGVPNAFGLWPSPYNYPAPYKRPLSSTTPTIVESPSGAFLLALGGSGGSRIFPALFQTLVNILDYGMDVGEAVEFGRVHDQLYPLVTEVDSVYPEEGVTGLRERGHNVTVADINRVAAVVNAVMNVTGTIYAASDSRKNGVAAGY
ncbi:gamma-glutamyltranspeptidase [Heliocybe sulcata]|uniref:Glutathione hydrolase n=1 Tax=Heliocybe sulcata TaxID=5364 RepID=A0A5C3N8C4_9AGAM|nr:gamma-glutamyltranspeptidase [Heliocybe sulcata]